MLHRCERVTCLVLLTLTSAPSVSDAERIAPLPPPRASYSYDRADQLSGQILNATLGAFTYDGRGNLTASAASAMRAS